MELWKEWRWMGALTFVEIKHCLYAAACVDGYRDSQGKRCLHEQLGYRISLPQKREYRVLAIHWNRRQCALSH